MMSQENKQDAPADWTQAEAVLENWYRRARESSLAQYAAAQRKRWHHTLLGMSTVILTAVTSATAVSSLLEQAGSTGKTATAILSVLSAIAASLQTFLKWDERANQHKTSAAGYSDLRRSMELIKATPRSSRAAIKEVIVPIQTEYSRLAKEAPPATLSDVETQKLKDDYNPLFPPSFTAEK